MAAMLLTLRGAIFIAPILSGGGLVTRACKA